MCRAQSDPRGGYRCDWRRHPQHFTKVATATLAGSGTADRIDNALVRACGAGMAGGAAAFPGDVNVIWNEIVSAAAKDVATSADEAISGRPDALKDLRAALGSTGRLLSDEHVLCGLAAAIGAVCATLPDAQKQLADAVGAAVGQRTESALADAIARAATQRLIDGIVKTAGIPDTGQVGVVADACAVAICPRSERHPEVVECEERLGGKAAELATLTLLGVDPDGAQGE